MLTYENVETCGWAAAIRGARNPMNSWKKSDSSFEYFVSTETTEYVLGPNDYDLCKRLIKAGPDHRKFLRMIHVQFDVTAPLSWWKEADTFVTV